MKRLVVAATKKSCNEIKERRDERVNKQSDLAEKEK